MLNDLRRAPFSGWGQVPVGVGAPGEGAEDEVGQNREIGHPAVVLWSPQAGRTRQLSRPRDHR